jgi:glyoxylase-like metal-dependent hydrolase (beta-lactamase superfamily II)
MGATAPTRAAPSRFNAAAAELPLPGGQSGATLALHPLLCAVMRGPRGWFERAPGRSAALKALGIGVPSSELIDIPIIAFLLEHPTAGLVLVDTGFHRTVAEGSSRERSRNLGAVGKLMARNTRMEPEQAAAAQLQARGIDPADVGLVVMTHLHFDHASALSDFPAATVLVSAPEWTAAHGRYPFMHGYVPAQFDPRPSYRTLDFTAARADGADPLEHALDVFGDGSLRLVFTPGHTLGHMSLLLRLPDREALLTGDAAYTLATLREGARPWLIEDKPAFERSARALAAWARAHPEALVVPGHDMPAWEALQERYG